MVRDDSLVPDTAEAPASQLRQWPVQIKLAPVRTPYFQNANLLIAADCTAISKLCKGATEK